MKTMVERNEVLHRYRIKGQSKRQIAEELHISRHTVDKIVWEYERVCLDADGVCDMEAFAALIGSEPKFHTPVRQCPVVTDEIKGLIRKCLEENRVRRATGMRKLQWTCRGIHSMLLEKGFTLSYPSVCNHVSRISATMGAKTVRDTDLYIRREHDPGRECEFDWGEIPLVIGGRRRNVQMAVFTLLHSNRRSAWLFLRQDTLSLMEAHRNFFMEIQGVPQTMVYDNMRVAVTIRTGRKGRPAVKYPTRAMRQLALYYRFCERFCNARAGFPQLKYLGDLLVDELPQDARTALPLLRSLDFVREGRNVVLYGNPGTGKPHLATALEIEACAQGMTVMFTSVHRLITQIREARQERTLRLLENRFVNYDLVICDEFGYVSCDKNAGELLFNHLSLRAGKKSVIITTNLAFNRWGEIIADKVLVAAMVDRLTHKAMLINMTGESFRMKETKKLLKNNSDNN